LQGEEYEPCQFFLKNFKTVCPNAWIEKWDDQREKVQCSAAHCVPAGCMDYMDYMCLFRMPSRRTSSLDQVGSSLVLTHDMI
jgi:hypothetical protein